MGRERLKQQVIADGLRLSFRSWRSGTLEAKHLRGLAVVEQRILSGLTPEKAVFESIESALERLAEHSTGHVELLRARWGGTKVAAVASRKSNSEQTIYKKQDAAYFALAGVLLQQEQEIRGQREARSRRLLPPPPYSQLVATEAKIAQLMPHFEHAGAPWLVALVGMGGVGKTTLAYTLVEELLASARFDRVAWVSAQQVLFSLDGTMELLSEKPALTLATLVSELGRQLLGKEPEAWSEPVFLKEEKVMEHLLANPSLVVVDNLETAADAERLIPFMRSARGPSKFILTSRVTPTGDGAIFNYQVPPLTFDETLKLIRLEAAARNLVTLLECDRATARKVYDATGGNPLALRLVVGQIHHHGLGVVLDELRHAHGTGAMLYRYLYDWLWHTLGEPQRAVLRSMVLLTDDNLTPEAIATLSGLSPAAVRAALQQLVRQNLVTLGGALEQRRYGLHNLTRAYLDEVTRADAPLAASVGRHD